MLTTNLQQHFCNVSIGSGVQGRAAGIIGEVHICALVNELLHERNVACHNSAQQPRFARAKEEKRRGDSVKAGKDGCRSRWMPCKTPPRETKQPNERVSIGQS